jgi:hypothetical protein
LNSPAFTRALLPDQIWLRCVRENGKAWRWYERKGFVFEKQAIEARITDGSSKEPFDDETVLVAAHPLVFRALADGRNRAAL